MQDSTYIDNTCVVWKEPSAAADEGREPAVAQKEGAQKDGEQVDAAPAAAISAPVEISSPAPNAAPAAEAAAADDADADKTPVTDVATPAPAAEPAASAAETPATAPDAPASTVSPSAEAEAPAIASETKPPPTSFTFGSAFKASNGTGFAALAGANPQPGSTRHLSQTLHSMSSCRATQTSGPGFLQLIVLCSGQSALVCCMKW